MRAWGEVLANPAGQGVVVVGNQGMGKSMLLKKLAELTTSHPELRCGAVNYEVVPSDTFESVGSLMLDDAYQAAAQTAGSFAPTDQRRRQWKALLGIVPSGDKLYELVSSLRRDPNQNVRVQLLERMQLISSHLPDNGRAVFFVDPEKYLGQTTADAWRLLIRDLPAKFKVVIAQRNDDVLATNQLFWTLPNVVRLTELGTLEQQDVEEFVRSRSTAIVYDIREVLATIDRYRGHPYAVAAALDLLVRKEATPASLAADPTPECISEIQWNSVCKHGPDAIRLFRAFAVLEAPAKRDLASEVAAIPPEAVESLIAHDDLRALLREETSGYAIYHSLLSDHILAERSKETEEIHARAIDAYRKRLTSDDAAALRLPRHLRALHGDSGFVAGVIVSAPRLLDRGLYDSFFELADAALNVAPEASSERAALLLSVATAKFRRGEFDDALSLLHTSIGICQHAGDVSQKALALNQLGELHLWRGEMDEAEAPLNEALRTFEASQLHAGIAQCLNSLGRIDQHRGRSRQAEERYRASYDAARASNDPSQVALALASIATFHEERGDDPGAVKVLQEALKQFESSGYSEGRASVLGRLGHIYRRQRKIDDALAAHREALEIGKTLVHPLTTAQEYADLSYIYLNDLNDFDQAEEMIRAALDIERRIGLSTQIGKRYSVLSRIYHARNDFKMAKFMAEAALSIFTKSGDVEAMATEWANLGATLHSEKSLAEAHLAYQRAMRLAEQIGSSRMQMFVLDNLGVLYREQENWTEALKAHGRALELHEKTGDRGGMAHQKQRLGVLRARLGDHAHAIELLEDALAIYREIGDSRRLDSVSAMLDSLRRQ